MNDEKLLSSFKNNLDLISGTRFSLKEIFLSSGNTTSNIKYKENNSKVVKNPNSVEDLMISKKKTKTKIIH